MSGTEALVLKGLRKVYAKPAVDDLDLTIHAGELYALLGPNGAGKTTTLRMVAGLLRPDAGSVSVFGIDALADPIAAKRLVAWLPDEPMLYDKLTPIEYLQFVAGLWGVEAKAAYDRAEELLRWLDLWDHRNERCEGFSRGMKQKASLSSCASSQAVEPGASERLKRFRRRAAGRHLRACLRYRRPGRAAAPGSPPPAGGPTG